MNLMEKTGEKFNLEIFMEAREICQEVVKKIATQVETGLNEADGQYLVKQEFQKQGVSKFWHPSKFRIAADTTKTFRALPDNDIHLQTGDIFFIDVGPIIQDHEADYGETFIYSDPKQNVNPALKALTEASRKVWNETARAWKSQNLSGEALYRHANTYTESLGYTLDQSMAGHRLSDFPHALFTKEKLASLGFKPSDHLWVLEILITDKALNRGAFFEDLLR